MHGFGDIRPFLKKKTDLSSQLNSHFDNELANNLKYKIASLNNYEPRFPENHLDKN